MAPIIAAIARVAAGAVGRAGLRGLAGGAARFALGRGGAKAAAGAARVTGSQFNVLANSGLTNARAITAAFRGGAAATASGSSAAGTQAAGQAANASAQQAAAAQQAGMQAMIGSSGGRGGGGGGAPPAAGSSGASPGGGGGGNGGGSGPSGSGGGWHVTRAFNGLREFGANQLAHLQRIATMGSKQAQQYQQLMRSTGDKTAGLSESERAQRLQQNGFMPSQDAANKHFTTPNASMMQRIQLGESQEEEARQKNIAELERGAEANKEFAKIMSKLSGGLLGVPGAVIAFVKGMELAATLQVESMRKFARYNSQIAGAFARLDYGDIRRTASSANANAGSASRLTDGLNRLRDEMQPFRQTMTTGVNTAMTVGVWVARGIASLVRVMPAWTILERLAKAQEEANRKAAGKGPQADFRSFAGDVAAGKYNKRP